VEEAWSLAAICSRVSLLLKCATLFMPHHPFLKDLLDLGRRPAYHDSWICGHSTCSRPGKCEFC
jgi:hypothetical protein